MRSFALIAEPIFTAARIWQTGREIVKTTQFPKMPRSTNFLRSDREQGVTDADGAARNIIDGRSGAESPGSWRRPGEGSALEELLRWAARSLALLAVLSSVALLCVGATPLLTDLPRYTAEAALRGWTWVKNLPLSALPLLLAGSSYIILQAILRPRPLELLKRLMLGTAFLLWGVVQLMRASDLATELGNLVIALYVVDLGLIVWTELRKTSLEAIR
jgi:hypothetical protein